jgi:hypothetical protein
LVCGPRTGKRAPLGLGSGGGRVRGGDALSSGMTSGPHRSASAARGERSGGGRGLAWAERPSGLVRGCWLARRLGLLAAGPADWSGLRCKAARAGWAGWRGCWAAQAGGLDGGEGRGFRNRV